MKQIKEKIKERLFKIRYHHSAIDKFLYGIENKRNKNLGQGNLYVRKVNKGLMILVIFLLVFLVLIIIGTHYWFTTTTGSIPVGQELEKSDWLIFWGSYLGFLGTSILGGIAFWQNYRLDKVNKRLTEQNTISTFHSFLIPQSIGIELSFLEANEFSSLSEETYQFMTDQPIPDRWALQIAHGVINICFLNKTDFFPTKYLVNSIKLFVPDGNGSKKNIFISDYFYGKELKYSFSFDFPNNIEFIAIHLPIHGGNRDLFREMFTVNQLFLEIDFSYINPFNILAHSILSTEFTAPVNDNGSFSFTQKNTFFTLFECLYKKLEN